jgi:hypothetical protein
MGTVLCIEAQHAYGHGDLTIQDFLAGTNAFD